MSPLKKRVMSSTKSTPWQEVKSNCRTGRQSVLDLGPHRTPPLVVCWPLVEAHSLGLTSRT